MTKIKKLLISIRMNLNTFFHPDLSNTLDHLIITNTNTIKYVKKNSRNKSYFNNIIIKNDIIFVSNDPKDLN